MQSLEATGITLVADRQTVLTNIDFRLDPGEVVGLLGPNGAGKSSLMRVLAGLAPPARGAVRCAGAALGELSPQRRARLLGYLPQGAQAHWPLTVAAVVALGRLPHRAWWQPLTARDRELVERAMIQADVMHLSDRPVTHLSGGERLRVLLARLFATEPAFVLADEPVAALDPFHQLQVMELLRHHARQGGAVVVVMHDLNLAARFCDRLVLLSAGRVAAAGTPREVLRPRWLQAVYGVEARVLEVEGEFAVVPWRRLDLSDGLVEK